MAEKKKGYPILLLVTVLLTVGGLVTLIPAASASKQCMLGYKALCAWAPISALLCFLAAAIVCIIRKKKFA